MAIYNGTTYHDGTPIEVVNVLETARFARNHGHGYRLRLHYGEDGKAWGDGEEGYIARSMGPIMIPLIIYNRRSMGGPAVLDQCIVKIEEARGKRVLWQHPDFEPAYCEYCGAEHLGREVCRT